MIAVWLVGPPRRVASPVTRDGSSPAVSAGARSSASRTDGSVGRRDARLGLAGELGDDAVAQVVEVGDALGHEPAHLAEQPGELVDGGAAWRAARRCRLRTPLTTLAEQAAVAGEHGGGLQHLGRDPAGGGGAGGQAVGDRSRRRR